VVLKCKTQFRYVTEAFSLYTGAFPLASYPGPSFQEEEKGPGIHCTRMRRGTPEKKLDTIVYSLFTVHRAAHHAKSANDHYGNATDHYGDPGACAHSVYQALSPPLERKGLGTRLPFPLLLGHALTTVPEPFQMQGM
jgi:hypothetical protein